MSFMFLVLIAIQVTFALGLGWFWLERTDGRAGLPPAGWLVAIIPVAAFGVGVIVGPELAYTRSGVPTVQDTIAFVTMWGCYFVGATVTLLASLQHEPA